MITRFILYSLFHRTTRASEPILGLYRYLGEGELYFDAAGSKHSYQGGQGEKHILHEDLEQRKLKGDTVKSSEIEARADLARGKETLY